jgi:AcrR family transcriptional regulator
MARTTDVDWVDVALTLLKAEGHAALTVERLCRAGGMSKGSLYHHHAHLPALKAAALARWQAEHTERLIAATRGGVLPAGATRRQHLDALAFSLDRALEQAVRNWGAHDPLAGAAVRAVDEQRIAYLAELAGDDDPVRARRLATLEYALFLGLQQLPAAEQAWLLDARARDGVSVSIR